MENSGGDKRNVDTINDQCQEKNDGEQQPLKKIKASGSENENEEEVAEPMDEDKTEVETLINVGKLSAQEVRQKSQICGEEGCNTTACLVYTTSNHKPEQGKRKVLFQCADHARDIDKHGIDDRSASEEWKKVVRKECTTRGNNAEEVVVNALLDSSSFTGAYLTLPGVGKAMGELISYINDHDHPFNSFLDSTISLPSNTTKLEEATFILNILREVVHRYQKISAGQWRHEEYEGLNDVGAEEVILDKFQSVMSRYEPIHYTDEDELRMSAECIIGIWRDYSTKADAHDSQHFEDLDLNMKNALRKFWGRIVN